MKLFLWLQQTLKYEHPFLGDNINAEVAEEQREEIIRDLYSSHSNHDLKSFQNRRATASERYTVYHILLFIEHCSSNMRFQRKEDKT